MHRHILPVVLVLVAVGLVGCAERVTWEPESGTWSETRVSRTLEREAASDEDSRRLVLGRPTEQAPKLRQNALVWLRGQGDAGTDAADLITETLPPSTTSAPFYVGKGTFEGKDAVVVIEAYGAPGGTLSSVRAWVLSPEGDVLYAAGR